MHVISLEPPVRLDEKPPDYATVVDVSPPSYDDAIKLDPHRLLTAAAAQEDTCAVNVPAADERDKTSTTLAQAIRKSIRDIRKQLTNGGDAADVEQQQQSGSERRDAATGTPVVLK